MKYYLYGEEVTSREYLQWQKEQCFIGGILPDVEIVNEELPNVSLLTRMLNASRIALTSLTRRFYK